MSNNKKTPLIQKLRSSGGTLIAFPSASEDIGLNLQATTSGVAMSHYALLNIPQLAIENCIKECSQTITCDDPNLAISMSLQNYMMNFETLLVNEDTYNYQALQTVTEKAFWHWAMHIGMLDPSTLDNTKCGNSSIYVESGYDSDPNIADDTVVKCFGSIDAGNSLSTEFGMFNETYITIPTSWGAGPIYFESSEDDNYKLNKQYQIDDKNRLEGRSDTYSYYTYTNGQDYPFYDDEISDVAFYKTTSIDGLQIVKNINEIQEYSKKRFNNDSIIIGSYDDVNIDNQNFFGVDQKFEFNAILLYYSIYDQDDLVKTAYATNLFGIIFLDGCNIDNIANQTFVIPTLTKTKSTTDSFGNSFSFRANLKTMSVYDNTDAVIQDNTTTTSISAVEFSDAISNMNRAIDIMNSNLQTVINIQDQYAAILSYYDNMEQELKDLSTCLHAYLNGTRSSFVDTSILYVNEILPSEKSTSNTINIKSRTGNVDSDGNTIYNNAMSIYDSKVDISTLSVDVINSNYSYVNIINVSICDKNIVDISDGFTKAANDTLNRICDSDELVIKVRESDSTEYNSIYIDPESPIFVNDTYGTSLKELLDASNNINYVAFIPYIIAKLQQLNS